MDSATLAATISGAIPVIVVVLGAGLTYFFTKRREREADWRKVKLEYYREYIASVAGMVEGRATPESHLRYTDAVNTIPLVASPSVLKAIYAYEDEISVRNTERSDSRHDELLNRVVHALRQDISDVPDREGEYPAFRLITVRPDIQSTLDRPR